MREEMGTWDGEWYGNLYKFFSGHLRFCPVCFYCNYESNNIAQKGGLKWDQSDRAYRNGNHPREINEGYLLFKGSLKPINEESHKKDYRLRYQNI